MKNHLLIIVTVLGLVFLWSCSASPARVSQNDSVNATPQATPSPQATDTPVPPTDESTVESKPTPTDEPVQASEAAETIELTETSEPQPTEATGAADTTTESDEAKSTVEVGETKQNSQLAGSSQVDETGPVEVDKSKLANVIGVEAAGNVGSYTFSVRISSPDTGCEQYADWWEVLSEDGTLIYRRVLLHSHPNEQPFVRSGGPVEIAADQVVWVRAHMNPGGYGGQAFRGSAETGFQEADLSPDFAAETETLSPLPNGCAF